MTSRKPQNREQIEQERRAKELQLLFKLLGEDPLTQELCVKLNTLAEPSRSEIFLLPGREGCGCIFKDLAKSLKVPAVALQYNNSHPEKNMSIQQMASDIYPHLLERRKNRKDFFIVAYSFGTLVAIELVRKLEAEGLTGKFISIDASPELLRAFVDERFRATSQHEFEMNILTQLAEIFVPRIVSQLSAAVKFCKSWDEKLKTFIKYTPSDMCGLTPEGLRTLFTVMRNRTTAVQVYTKNTHPPINTPILLLKAFYRTVRTAVDDDYGLRSVTKGHVDVRVIKDGHGTILSNPEVASIINTELELPHNKSI